MISYGLFEIIYNLLNLFIVTDIPPLSDQIYGYISQFFEYLSAGASILGNYIPLGYAFTLFFIVIAVDMGIAVYHFVMWILNKIPAIDID